MFNYHIVEESPKALVSFTGDFDIDATELVEEKMTPELLNYVHIEIDFSGVYFVDSSGIGLLITLIQQLKENKSFVQVVRLNEDVKQIFELLQLPEILGSEVLSDFSA